MINLTAGNEASLDQIDSGLFMLVLDDEKFEDDSSDLTRAFVHGNGTNRFLCHHFHENSKETYSLPIKLNTL